MKTYCALLLAAIVLSAASAVYANSTTPAVYTSDSSTSAVEQELNLSKYFEGYQGTFVLLDTKSGRYSRFNPTLASVQLSPCSTFKIFNTLVGLETGVLNGPDHLMKWNGTTYGIADWNQDQTLRTAIKYSCVWYFQRVAAGIGEKRMRHYIDLAHYGNQDISGGITSFWLGNSLKISANEQVQLLRRLYDNDLPFSKKTMATTKELLSLKSTDKGVLHGKTGSDMVNGKRILGWFVGYVEQPGHTYIFATNIQAQDGAWGPKARSITEKILHDQGVL